MPDLLEDPSLDQIDPNQEADIAEAIDSRSRPQASASVPIASTQVAPKTAPSGPPAPPTWPEIQSSPQFQQAPSQVKQEAFTKWIGSAHYYGEAAGFVPTPAEKAQMAEWTAKQARDLGMASFIDPNSGRAIPINTSMIQDYGARVEQSVGQATGNTIEGLAHESRYINPDVWLDNLAKFVGVAPPPGSLGVTDQIENMGRSLREKADAVPTNPLYDQSAEAQVGSFVGSMLPMIASGGLAAVTGSGMMAQQFKNDAVDAKLDPLSQEGAFAGGAAIGYAGQKLAGIVPMLREATGAKALKDALSSSTTSTLLKAFALNTIRGGIEGAAQTAGEQVLARHEDPTTPENLKQDWEGAMTFAIGQGLLGTGFKAMGDVTAKRTIQANWEANNADLKAQGQPPQTLADYTSDLLKETPKATPPPVPVQGDISEANVPSEPAANPLDEMNQSLEKQIATPSEPTVNMLPATHPVFGEGTYPPESLLGEMGTNPIEPGKEQLSWDGKATDQVRTQTPEGEWTYAPATSEELAHPNFQSPEITKEDLLKPPAETAQPPPLTKADVLPALATGPETTKETLNENQATLDRQAPTEQPGEPSTLLDQTGLHDKPLDGKSDERANAENVPLQDGRQDRAKEDVAQLPDENKPAQEAGAKPEPQAQSEAPTQAHEDAKAVVSPLVDKAVKANKVKGATVVYSTKHPNAAWADPNERGKIFVNPEAMAKALEKLPDQKAKDEYLKRTVAEEVAHGTQHSVEADWTEKGTHEQNINRIFDEVSDKEKAATIERYGDERIDPSKAKSPEDAYQRKTLFVREHARQILQRKMAGETTEDVWKSANKPALLRYFRALYEKLKARIANGSGSHLGAYLKATEGILRDAKKEGQDIDMLDAIHDSVRTGKPKFASDITAVSMPKKAQEMLDVTKALGKELRADLPTRYALDRTAAKRKLSAEQQRSSQQVTKIVNSFNKAIPDPVRRDAVTIYREAGGDDTTLKAWEKGTKDPELKKAYKAAQNLMPDEKAWADKITQTYDLTRKRLVQMGVDVAEISNYANHVWKDNAIDKLKRTTSKGLKTAFQYAKQRKIPSYFEGEQLGLEPETKDAGKLLGGYILDANRVIASRQFIADLSKGKEADGRPIVAPKSGGFIHLDKGDNGKIHLVFNGRTKAEFNDYRDDLKIPALSNWAFKGTFDGTTVMGKSDLALHPNAHSDLKNIFGRSPIREWWDSPSDSVASQIVKSSAKFLFDDLNSYGKTTLFGGLPFFHAVQETMEGASHLSLPSKGSEYLKEPDLSDPAIFDKSVHGLMLAPDRASQALFEDGMDSSRRNLVVKALKHIPGIGPKIQEAVDFGQEWLFETYIPSLKNKMYDVALARNLGRFEKELSSGKITESQVKFLTADQTNNAFGHMNYTDIARSPLMQHMMQMVILAPDFSEARLRHFGIWPGNDPTGVAQGIFKKGGREQAAAMFGLSAAIYLTARVLNASLNNGDVKWDEPFSVVYKNRRYGVRFAGGDIYELFKNWRGWVGGREAPITRAALEVATGVNYRGEPVSTMDAFRDALAGNMPMYLQPMLRGLSVTNKNNPVSPLEQFMSSVGMKISRYSPISQVYPLAKDWKDKHGSEFGLKEDKAKYPTSAYTPMKYALDDANYPEAWSQYQALVKDNNGNAGTVLKGLQGSIYAPFTGSHRTDQAFFASLTPEQQQIYRAAVERRMILWQRVGAMFSEQDKKK